MCIIFLFLLRSLFSADKKIKNVLLVNATLFSMLILQSIR